MMISGIMARLSRSSIRIGVSVLVLILSSCSSIRYAFPSLPAFSIPVPDRPVLQMDDAEGNTVQLVGYAMKLEAVIEGWECFYSDLQEVFGDGDS